MSTKKKSPQKRRHPHVKQALADVEKIHKAHKKLELALTKVKKTIRMIPHSPA